MKLLFKIIDYSAALLMGVGTVLAVSLIVDEGWNMIISMVTGMIVGMIILMLIALLFSGVTTFFHIMSSGMMIAMIWGMMAGMLTSDGSLSLSTLCLWTLLFSFLVQFGIDLYNHILKGEVPLDACE